MGKDMHELPMKRLPIGSFQPRIGTDTSLFMTLEMQGGPSAPPLQRRSADIRNVAMNFNLCFLCQQAG